MSMYDNVLIDFWGIPNKGRDKMYHVKITKWIETEEWSPRDHGVVSEEVNEKGDVIKEYGYPRQVKQKGQKEIAVLEQTIEEIDLPAVIAAINGLTLKDA